MVNNMYHKLISIIVPVYQVEEYLCECIESVLLQTHKLIELVLIDDGSTDGSATICDRYAKEDERVVVIHQRNSGVSSARNAGIKRATGDYIGFVDADDTIEPQMYEEMLEKMTKQNTQMCVSTKYRYNDTQLDNSHISENLLSKRAAILKLLQMNFPTSLCSCLYKNSIFIDNFLNEEIHYWEDFEFQLRALDKVRNVSICSFPYYHYRQRVGSANHQPINDNVISCMSIAPIVESFILHHYPDLRQYTKDLYVVFLQYLIGNLSKSPVVTSKYFKIITKYSRKYLFLAMKTNRIKPFMKIYIIVCSSDSKLFWKIYRFIKYKRRRER